jgi:biopolymer transport protein ExbB/TolQ
METSIILTSFLQHLGPFKIPMFAVLIVVFILIVLLAIETFSKSKANVERRRQNLSALLILGSMNLALGMLGQIMGIWYALAAIMQADDVSPAIVIEGLQASFGTTYFGLITFFIAFVGWLIFNYVSTKQAASDQ